MEKDMNLDDLLWEGYEYLDEMEQFLEIQTMYKSSKFELQRRFTEVVFQTKKEMDEKKIIQYPEFGIEHVSLNGERYVIRENCIHKIKKNHHMITILSGNNELLTVPSDHHNYLYCKPLNNDD